MKLLVALLLMIAGVLTLAVSTTIGIVLILAGAMLHHRTDHGHELRFVQWLMVLGAIGALAQFVEFLR